MKGKSSRDSATSEKSGGGREREQSENTPTRTRGRPRVVDPGLSPSDRAIAWQQDWARIGGHRTAVNLGPTSWDALQKMARKRDRSALIERLILQEARSRGLKPT